MPRRVAPGRRSYDSGAVGTITSLIVTRKSLLAVATAALLFFHAPSAQGAVWKEVKGTHFIIYHAEQDKEFAKKALRKAEGYYKSIPDRLGITRYSQFWTWDNRVKFYVYPDRASFLAETRKPNWVRATANYEKRVITSYKGHGGKEFLDTTLPHELTHLVFRDFLGFKTKAPLWLDEGVAQAMETGKADKAGRYVRRLLKTDNFITVGTLTRLDIRRVRDRELVTAFYLEACSLVDFLIKEYGSVNFMRFCRAIRDCKPLNDALRTSYPSAIGDVDKLNAKWILSFGPAMESSVRRADPTLEKGDLGGFAGWIDKNPPSPPFVKGGKPIYSSPFVKWGKGIYSSPFVKWGKGKYWDLRRCF